MKIKTFAFQGFAVLCLLFLSTNYVQAAGMGGGGTPPCGGAFPPCPIPLDGGVTLLLIAGAAYGGIKIYNSFIKNPA